MPASVTTARATEMSTVETPVRLVGEAGFEPATPWPPAKCAAGLRYSPIQPVSLPRHPILSSDEERRIGLSREPGLDEGTYQSSAAWPTIADRSGLATIAGWLSSARKASSRRAATMAVAV